MESKRIPIAGGRLKRTLPLLGVMIGAAALWIVYRQVKGIDPAGLMEQLRAYPRRRVAVAALCSVSAFMLYALYESILLHRIQPRVGFVRPFLVSLIVSPIGHSVGFATLSAGALRYRMYAPLGLSPAQLAATVILCAFPFVLGLGVLLDISLVLDPQASARALHLPVAAVLALGCAGLLKDAGYPLLTLWYRRPLKLGRFTFYLPDIKLTLLQIAIGTVDMACVAAVLYVFMPPELGMGFSGFLVIYIISAVAGSLSSVPAGLGVLEAALLLMLPQVPREKLLAAVLAYRFIFEVLPLLFAIGLFAVYELGSRHGIGGRLWRKPAV